MNSITVLIPLTIVAVAAVWFVAHLATIIKQDGYGFRSASGLPRDWAPPETQSEPYSVKQHF